MANSGTPWAALAMWTSTVGAAIALWRGGVSWSAAAWLVISWCSFKTWWDINGMSARYKAAAEARKEKKK